MPASFPDAAELDEYVLFDFELFTPDELRRAVELTCLFERSSPDEPRMLLVFER